MAWERRVTDRPDVLSAHSQVAGNNRDPQTRLFRESRAPLGPEPLLGDLVTSTAATAAATVATSATAAAATASASVLPRSSFVDIERSPADLLAV